MATIGIICCDSFADAMQAGTDNEGYGALLRPDGDRFSVGSSELQHIRFCPWCGANKRVEHPLVAAAKHVTMTYQAVGGPPSVLSGAIELLSIELNKELSKWQPPQSVT